jgi:hypothetical protein
MLRRLPPPLPNSPAKSPCTSRNSVGVRQSGEHPVHPRTRAAARRQRGERLLPPSRLCRDSLPRSDRRIDHFRHAHCQTLSGRRKKARRLWCIWLPHPRSTAHPATTSTNAVPKHPPPRRKTRALPDSCGLSRPDLPAWRTEPLLGSARWGFEGGSSRAPAGQNLLKAAGEG